MPIVFMNDDTRFVGKIICFMRMPADVALAYDGCGCTESGRHDHHCADCGCGKDYSEHYLLVSIGPLPGVQTPWRGLRFRGGTKILAGLLARRRPTRALPGFNTTLSYARYYEALQAQVKSDLNLKAQSKTASRVQSQRGQIGCRKGSINRHDLYSTTPPATPIVAAEMTRNPAEAALSFLEQLRPAGPWVLTAIIPDGLANFR
jgi:hypothetical protein